MGKITVLNESISSKIAAGEVVERPASVVKELVENSLDAGSKHVTIEIKKGGKKLIKVIDDGEGIAREDVRLAFERHATSKIARMEDIFNIKTLGFRGEALPSIAAVAQVVMLTKTCSETLGTRCELEGGVIKSLEEATANNGCIIEVKNLFFNTPARLKFLNTDSQESSYITDLVIKLAIGNPEISFRLINDGKEIFYTSGSGDYREVLAKAYGVELARHMIHVEKPFGSGRVFGFISPPRFSRGNRTGEIFFVNRRFVKDRGLSFSLERAYKTLLPVGRFPIASVFIDIESSLIDVNVHPSKTEIKFQRENEVQQALYSAVAEGLKSNILIPKETLSVPPQYKSVCSAKVEYQNETLLKDEYFTNKGDKINKKTETFPAKLRENPPVVKETVFETPKVEPRKNGLLGIVKILGQLFGTYIVAQGEEKFYLVDQHAAHERILFELYSNRFNRRPASQTLISPCTLQLPLQDMAFIEEHQEDIKNMGFDISIFGRDTVLVRSVPYFFNRPADPEVLREVLDRLKGEEFAALQPKERFIASMACHTAIKAGDALSFEEMAQLLSQLEELENPYTCPHGRPTIISVTLHELEVKFKRVQ
ncbi:DNA mismatch repair endonuclease MutL [Thermoanaerobacterium sp. DL9XJH110]|uniref:DNA mismatch repair endonuclease MutL n=1 Tax=Thermoanaerobacterium sp. DL9XJH110 TaxID=3386643 RepID=UPI003BB7D556